MRDATFNGLPFRLQLQMAAAESSVMPSWGAGFLALTRFKRSPAGNTHASIRAEHSVESDHFSRPCRSASTADDNRPGAQVASKVLNVEGTLLRLRSIGSKSLVVNDAGRFLCADRRLDHALRKGHVTSADRDLLSSAGVVPSGKLEKLAFKFARARRHFEPRSLDYLILVPTLRCNLACSYCQVSRVALGSRGFDWTQETIAAVVQLVGGLEAKSVKIEFQGGEPTLRPDCIQSIINAVPPGTDAKFVICTNLQTIDDELLKLFDPPNVSLSTSLDGPLERHSRQRQADEENAARFFANLDFLLDRYGPSKISALPTIDPRSPPEIDELIEAFAERGLTSIYLRPINYQGFARKRHAHSKSIDQSWLDYHRQFIARLVERNFLNRDQLLEETYFSLLLRRIFRPGEDRHVDLRNPNPVGRDYVVIDHDGRIYPTDEARMLTRSGIIDLAIGDVLRGWDSPERAALDAAATNDGDPTCERCAYKPFCGRDIVDDIARYGTIDIPREETDFCRRHLNLFDLAFEMIHSQDEKIRYSLGRWLGLPGQFPTRGIAA